MREVPHCVAEEEYGEHLVVAALGALEKSETSFSVIHDGTHKAHVNQRIVPRDQLRTPGVPEVRVVLFRERAAGGARLGLTGDVSHAHRIPRVRRCDHGFHACRLRPGTTWLNEVGSIGISAARTGGAGSRRQRAGALSTWSWTRGCGS